MPFVLGNKHTEEAKLKIGNSQRGRKRPEMAKKMIGVRSGKKHPMYGKNHSRDSCEKMSKSRIGKTQTEETRMKISAANKGRKWTSSQKEKMSEVAKIRGSFGRGWGGWYKGWFFRSLGELRYVVEDVEAAGKTWESAEDKFSFKYEYEGVVRTYHPDIFVDGKILVEVKPKKYQDKPRTLAKSSAARKSCRAIGIEFILVDSVGIKFASLKRLVETGDVVLTEKWKERFLKILESEILL